MAHALHRVIQVGKCLGPPIIDCGNSMLAGCQTSVSMAIGLLYELVSDLSNVDPEYPCHEHVHDFPGEAKRSKSLQGGTGLHGTALPRSGHGAHDARLIPNPHRAAATLVHLELEQLRAIFDGLLDIAVVVCAELLWRELLAQSLLRTGLQLGKDLLVNSRGSTDELRVRFNTEVDTSRLCVLEALCVKWHTQGSREQ